jgi:alpha-mannosidase
MKKRILICLLVVVIAIFYVQISPAQNPGNPEGYLKGYAKTLRGGDFSYHSPQPNVTAALLVRSMEKNLYVEWETEPVPANYNKKEAKFIFLAAIDVKDITREKPQKWDIYINDRKQFTIKSPENKDSKEYFFSGPDGYILSFKITMTDQFGDQHGYMYLTAPEGRFEKGKPLKLKVEGESANSQTWFMVFKYGMEPSVKLIEEQAVTREGNNQYQQVRVEYVYMGEQANAVISTGDLKTNTVLNFGYNTIRAKLPVVTSSRSFPVSVSLQKGKLLLTEKNFTLDPVVPRTIHLLHHSHVDIGYTHVQDEVKQIQWRNLESAVKLASESQNFPEGARFRFNSEVMWPIETYLREQSPEKVKAMREAISKGWIELDAFYANTLTELCTTEELVRLTNDSRRIASECNVKLQSAMITDIPGWSWGIVPVLAKSGVKYLSLGTNSGDRIGSTIKDWGDRPFYWVSPSGEEKILCWIHEKAYSLFHTGLKYDELKFRLDEGKIFGYMNELYANNYPYEIITLRYNIGSDNGPTDPTLSDAVKLWNEKYVTPKVKIMTVSESFSEFEKRYGGDIPSVSGAFTGYWEDGAASTAAETAINRKAALNVNAAAALMVMNNNKGYNAEKMNNAWRNVLLYDEHTWGSWNSISDPENPFTLSQWANKKQFAIEALKQSNDLINSALEANSVSPLSPVKRIEVVNTHSWSVTDIVTIPSEMNLSGIRITDLSGKVVPSQKLSSGEVVFIAENVPAFGSKSFNLEKAELKAAQINRSAGKIENDKFILKVNKLNGSIESLIVKNRNIDLVDRNSLPGLNSYYYVAGRYPSDKYTPESSSCELIEDGPVTSVIKVTTEAKGSKSITNYYQLFNGLNKVVIKSEIDKEKIYTPEGVHLGFPFNVPSGVMHIDLAYGIYRPEADQLKAACKNYFTPEKWVDISNQDYGVTFVTIDAPMIEIGEITTDANSFGWLSAIKPSQTFYSYVMNNYWGTNYKASQDGPVTFRYSIHPHGMFISSDAERTAAEESDPLIIVPVSETDKEASSLFTLKSRGIVVTALVPQADGYLVRLFNAGGNPEDLEIEWRDKPSAVFFCDLDGNKTDNYTGSSTVPAWGSLTLRVRK